MRALCLSAVLLVACREQPAPAPSSTAALEATSVAKTSPLTRVDSPSHVCMVNDRYMGSEQIPVNVDGKTYYGCCAGCKDKLQTQNTARTALDPVTGKPVDKATAVIARTETGKVMYFESAETLGRFQM